MVMKSADKLTLAELEALAARMEAAARTIRESMAIVGGQQSPSQFVPMVTTGSARFYPPGPPQPNPLVNSEDTDPRAQEGIRQGTALRPMTEAQAEREHENRLYLQSQKGRRDAVLATLRPGGMHDALSTLEEDR